MFLSLDCLSSILHGKSANRYFGNFFFAKKNWVTCLRHLEMFWLWNKSRNLRKYFWERPSPILFVWNRENKRPKIPRIIPGVLLCLIIFWSAIQHALNISSCIWVYLIPLHDILTTPKKCFSYHLIEPQLLKTSDRPRVAVFPSQCKHWFIQSHCLFHC